MKSRKKILLVFACCVAFVLLFATVRLRQVRAAHPAPVIKPAVVRCMPLEPRPYRVTESFYGTIEANVRVDMAFRVPGRIAQLGPGADRMLRENDRVEVGDVIARLEPLVAAGAQHLSFGPPLGPDPLDAVRILGRDVLTHFR